MEARLDRALRVLLVENHEDTLTFLARHIERRGHRARSARSMAGALEALARESTDVLISDIGLPDGDGWELLHRVRAMNQSPFGIAMSGFGMATDRERSEAAGYRHHLIKPFLPEELDALLEEAVREAVERSATAA